MGKGCNVQSGIDLSPLLLFDVLFSFIHYLLLDVDSLTLALIILKGQAMILRRTKLTVQNWCLIKLLNGCHTTQIQLTM